MSKRKTLRGHGHWQAAMTRFHLSPAEVQMARELRLNPKKLGRFSANRSQPWKHPLKEFIARLYRKEFGRSVPKQIPNAVLKLETSPRDTQQQHARPSKNKKAKRGAARTTRHNTESEAQALGLAISRAKSSRDARQEAIARLAYAKNLSASGCYRHSLKMLAFAKNLAIQSNDQETLNDVQAALEATEIARDDMSSDAAPPGLE